MMGIYPAVIHRLLKLLEKKGLTINALAEVSGVSPSTLKNIFYGKSKNPGIVTIKKLCDGLDISITEFFNTEEFQNLEQEIK